MRIDDPAQLAQLDFSKHGGLLPVVAQHAHTGEVLMLAFADREALARSLREGRMWYYSRSRNAYWRKGDTSGNGQRLVTLHADCDADAVVALVEPEGPSCHTGAWSCFSAPPVLPALAAVIAARASSSEPGSYTSRLLEDETLRLKKLGEEVVERALACRAGDREAAAEETADLIYHGLVAATAAGAGLNDVLAVLARRASGPGRRRAPPDHQAVEAEQHDRAENRDPQ